MAATVVLGGQSDLRTVLVLERGLRRVVQIKAAMYTLHFSFPFLSRPGLVTEDSRTIFFVFARAVLHPGVHTTIPTAVGTTVLARRGSQTCPFDIRLLTLDFCLSAHLALVLSLPLILIGVIRGYDDSNAMAPTNELPGRDLHSHFCTPKSLKHSTTLHFTISSEDRCRKRKREGGHT